MSEADKPNKADDPATDRLQGPGANANPVAGEDRIGSTGENCSSVQQQANGEESAREPLPGGAGTDAESPVFEIGADELAEWNEQVTRRMRQQTRRSFMVGGVATLAGVGGWYWLMSRRRDNGLPWPLRRGLEINEQFARDYYRRHRTAPDLTGKTPLQDRVNGDIGLDDPVDVDSWRLQVEGLADQDGPLALPLEAVKKLPRVSETFEFKCIEGWSVVTQWAGARFSDFMTAYRPATRSGDPVDLRRNPEDLPAYVGIETPDGGYYVGLEMESMLHPQTLLAYEMNGAPLTDDHGAPLRLVTPTKYGVKSIKRIGTIRYRRERPADYWAERGYDWYIGL